MRTLTVSYWTLTALGALAAVLTRADLAVGDRGPTPEWSLGGLLPPAVLLAVVALLGLVLAGSAALTGTGRRGAAVAVGSAAGLALASTVLSVELLAFLGYLPLGLVLAPFHEGMRESFLAATDLALLLQLAVLVGVVLWGITAATSLRGPTVLPTWARPEAAARWGRVAVLVAVVPPLAYALTRFVWLVYPLGFDRVAWEAGRATGSLLPGVWLGAFAVVGAVLTVGLVRPWGEVFPRWVPRLAGRRVPVTVAVVPASFVAVVLVPAGISMVRQVLSGAAGADIVADWAAFGPTFLWPLWGLALGAATLAYALRRRGERPAERVSVP